MAEKQRAILPFTTARSTKSTRTFSANVAHITDKVAMVPPIKPNTRLSMLLVRTPANGATCHKKTKT